MPLTVQRLGRGWERSIRALLLQRPEVNLFLLGFLDSQPLDRAHWYGVVEGDHVLGIVLLVPRRLVVPFTPDPAHAAAIGLHLRGRLEPAMLVGPREAGDRLWHAWAADRLAPDRRYDQRLYVLREPPGEGPVEGLRRARMSEWRLLARYAGLMEEEDLGRNPQQLHPTAHDRVVRDRVRNGRTWVLERDRTVVFQINVGTAIPEGCQVGGTWVPPRFRGRGHATEGMRGVARELLAEYPVVTLHVNEANTPAVRVYEKVGFRRDAPYRLLTV